LQLQILLNKEMKVAAANEDFLRALEIKKELQQIKF
jgi:hypothetical protein